MREKRTNALSNVPLYINFIKKVKKIDQLLTNFCPTTKRRKNNMLLKLPFVSSKPETIDFKAFMKGERTENAKSPQNRGHLYSFIPLNPAAMIDPVFMAIAAGILLVALIEKGLADSGNVSIAAFLSAFLKISFPVAGLTAIWFLLMQLKFLF